MLIIKPYESRYCDGIVALITNIQQNEFKVPITLADQPDLLHIDTFYQVNKGQFWVALNNAEEVVGTIALIDNNERYGTIRKMFVRADYRGVERGVSGILLAKLEQKARENRMNTLYLGTVEKLLGSHKFYRKNGFTEITKDLLPPNYPLMQVDNMFFKKIL